MKKLIYGGLFLAAVGIGFVGCKKSTEKIQPKEQSVEQKEIVESADNTKAAALWPKIKVKIAHTKKHTPGEEFPKPCGKPFWICVIFGSTALGDEEIISEEERQDNIAAIQLELIDDNRLKLIPDAQMTDESHIFKMTEDMTLDSETSESLGFESVTLKEGTYTLNPDEGEFGTVIVDISN